MFRLLYTDIGNLSDGDFERWCNSLSAERLNRVQAQKQESDRFLSAAAGYLLQTALKGVGVVDPQIYYNEHGKPYLKEGGVYFNLSHSGTVAVCAIASHEVGVDVQQVKIVGDNLIKRICTKEEYSFVTQSPDDVYESFCRIWAVKESVMKCLGYGLSLAPQRIEVQFSPVSCISIDGVKSELHFKEYGLDGYRIAVCASADDFTPCIDKITI